MALWRALRLLAAALCCARAATPSKFNPDGVLLARPKVPARGVYYPVSDFLNCRGSNFSSSWQEWQDEVTAYFKAGMPRDKSLYVKAGQMAEDLQPDLMPTSIKFPQVLVRQASVSKLRGFCLYGYAAALFIVFRHSMEPTHMEAIEQALGWVEWPLDFMESSDWPTLWRMVPLHLEEFRNRGDASWSESLEESQWGLDEDLLFRPTVAEVKEALEAWLGDLGASRPQWVTNGMSERGTQVLLQKALSQRTRRLHILVLGHHLGSSMEPFSMLQAALRVGTDLEVEASFHGQRHPKPGLVCKEFGYCEENEGIERWFRKYEQRWLGEYDWMPDRWDEALAALADVIRASDLQARAELVVCGGPAWFCAMLRTFWSVPMLLYFAWPITPLIPAAFKSQVFTQVRFLGQTLHPPAVTVVANWILAAQFASQVQMHVPVLRPHGLYVNRTYSPVPAPGGNPRVMVTRLGQWARVSGVALLEVVWSFMEQEKRERGRKFDFELVFLSIRIRGVDTNQPLTYKDFSEFHACIFWPWDVMMLLFNELYTITVPLLVPDRRWMAGLVVHALAHTEVNWWHIRGAVGGALPNVSSRPWPLPHLPWIEQGQGLREAAFWYELTDFVQFPHVTYFRSLPDMLGQTQNLDVPRIRRGMQRFNQVTLRESMDFYRRAAVELLR